MGLDAALDAVEEARHSAARDLRILAIQQLCRSDEVREQNGGELSLHDQILGVRAEVTETQIQVETDTEPRRAP
jgi:hypothetical protein